MAIIITGIFEANEKGFGFVRPEDENEADIFIPPSDVKGAWDGDKVEVRVVSMGDEHRGPEGIITKILERNHKQIIGRFERSKNFAFVVPLDKKISQDIFISKNEFNGAKNNEVVTVEITKWPASRRSAEGKVVSRLGKIGAPGVDILAIMYSHDLTEDFPKEVLAQVKKIQEEIPAEEYKKRRDLRDVKMVTIDGEDAKDLDDAVSISKLENGNYRLGVHIADVSFYVKEGSALDKEAYERGTSVYLVDRVIPMLPRKLSNGVCSLNMGEDRLAFSVMMEIDEKGKILGSDIFKSVIHIDERMNYSDVTKILEGDKALRKRYQAFVDEFSMMAELSRILRARRVKRGSIDFDIPEAKVILDESGKPIEIKKYEITVSNNIIEDFMLAANETVAERFFWLEVPFMFRVHDLPDSEKLEEFSKFIFNYGYRVKGLSKLQPKAFQELLKEIKGKPEEKIISALMLRSMQQARYSAENTGHFGLAAKYYCHFTSPIRRYPDLFIHRVMSELIENGYQFKNEKRVKKLRKLAVEGAKHSSEKEREAQLAERDSVDLKKAEYMAQFVGEEFEGIISSVTSFGFFVELENTIEGLVRVESIEDDYYIYQEKLCAMIGERTNKIYRLGDVVKVRLMRADIETRKIDFEVVCE
ncbi:MAG: ribonuclease R [Clostridia bacterium]|nr:ribonuclease R [Clostridia bacterium]